MHSVAEEANPRPVAQAPLDHQDRSHVCCYARRASAPAWPPAGRPRRHAPSYPTSCPVVPCGIGCSQTGRPICGAHALTGRHLQPICPELPICVTKQHNGGTRLKAGFVRHIHAQASAREMVEASPPTRDATRLAGSHFGPDSSVRSKPPRVGVFGVRRVGGWRLAV